MVASTPNDGEFVWTVTSDIGTGASNKVAIRSTANPAIIDTSNAPFTVVSTPVPPALSPTRPVGGELFLTDFYSDTYYTSNPAVDPQGPPTGTQYVFRGGAWDDNVFYCRSASRSGALPTNSGIHMGFRVVRLLGEP